MKKNKVYFETKFWIAYEIERPFEVVEALFAYAHLDFYKQVLGEAVSYANKRKVYRKEYPGQAFVCPALFPQSLLLPAIQKQKMESQGNI